MPPGEDERVVVWRLGDALLAAPLAAVVEVVPVSADGTATTRLGALELRATPGLPAPERPRRAVVIRTAGAPVAMAADDVEGVQPYTPHSAAPTPAWLGALPTAHLAGLIRLDDHRIAAVLAIDALPGA